LIRQRLDVIASRDRFPILKQEMRAFFAGYQGLAARIQAITNAILPADVRVLVVSKGDNDLLHRVSAGAEHFPQTPDGIYAGSYPADSCMAIDHLESLREAGATHLMFPGTAFWWLDHYAGFRQHLDHHAKAVWRDEHCLIYQLNGCAAGDSDALPAHVSPEKPGRMR
jgi:hypothetical protein